MILTIIHILRRITKAMIRRIAFLLSLILLVLTAVPALAEDTFIISLDLNRNAIALKPDSKGAQLTASLLPESAAGTRIIWMSSNESVATVDSNGYVTPRGKGTTTITAETANSAKDTCIVTVTDNLVTSLTLSSTELTMEDRTAAVLEAVIEPMTADNTDITWASSDKKVAVVNKNGKVFAKAPGECWISATANGGDDVIARCKLTVEKSDAPMKYVALTFDDGPCDNTLDILEILSEYDVNVTFFCLGELVKARPNHVRQAYALGHEIANHSYSHETLTKLSLEKAKKQMTDCDAAIKAAIGVEAKVYRAPGGSVNSKIAQYCGKPFIDWSVDTNDWKYRDPEHVWTFIAKNTGNNDIVLMHDIRPTTMEAMHKAIPYLLEQGFTLVTVSELIELTGWNDPSLIYEP